MQEPFSVDVQPVETGEHTVFVMRIAGTISTLTTNAVESAFDNAVAQDGRWFVLDFSHVQHITSGGLRMLLKTRRTALDAGGNVNIFGVRREIRENVFDALGFSNLFEICADQDEALAAISGQKG